MIANGSYYDYYYPSGKFGSTASDTLNDVAACGTM